DPLGEKGLKDLSFDEKHGGYHAAKQQEPNCRKGLLILCFLYNMPFTSSILPKNRRVISHVSA
ncbi:MAG: hypothetical protein WBK24_08005, partial [Dethiobacteria bacterium]